MKPHLTRWTVLLLACVLASGCKERHEPVKPTVELATASGHSA